MFRQNFCLGRGLRINFFFCGGYTSFCIYTCKLYLVSIYRTGLPPPPVLQPAGSRQPARRRTWSFSSTPVAAAQVTALDSSSQSQVCVCVQQKKAVDATVVVLYRRQYRRWWRPFRYRAAWCRSRWFCPSSLPWIGVTVATTLRPRLQLSNWRVGKSIRLLNWFSLSS